MSKLSITVKNTGNKTFFVDWDESDVKVKGGTYRRIGGGKNTCKPNDTVTIDDTATFAADASRRYRICTVEGDNELTTTLPSQNGFTSDSSPIFNINRG